MRRERTSPLPVEIERLALLGWRLTPATANKRGLFPGYLDVATCDLDTLEQWAGAHPGFSWKAVPDGSGILLLDIDITGATHADDGVATLRALCAAHGPLPPRPHGRTPSGGHLLVFRDPGTPVRRGSGVLGPGIDILHHRLAAMVAPSRRRDGVYRWVIPP
ncbi:bifunctional DNA primase/polymerase [Roseicella frigidaeris]|uniref:bifunctional DNA primase/polymerase n=1 Tax=Roseicella frigidaeris TaxID=2230885 RepID=UPI001403C64C|nr:bifunctional DNA primase/polymerase [Roseicella frigidaeris]